MFKDEGSGFWIEGFGFITYSLLFGVRGLLTDLSGRDHLYNSSARFQDSEKATPRDPVNRISADSLTPSKRPQFKTICLNKTNLERLLEVNR